MCNLIKIDFKVGRHTIGIMLKDFHFFMKRLDKSYINCVRVCVSEREREREKERERGAENSISESHILWMAYISLHLWVGETRNE